MRNLTLTVAQIQSLALKTMGFQDDYEVKIRGPYEDSMEIEFDIYHVRVGIDEDGTWRAYALVDGDAERILNQGPMPKLGRRSPGEPYPL